MKIKAEAFRAETAPANLRLALFHGPDSGLAADLARQLAARLTPGGDAMLALSPALLKDDPARLGDEAAAVSMFGNRLVIRVDGADESCAEAFALLLDLPAAGNPVVATAGQLRKGSKLLALVEASPDALAVIAYAPEADAAARGIAGIGGEFGLDIGRDAAERLRAATGGERGLIRQELEKAALYLDAAPSRPKRLTLDDLLAIGADIADGDFAPLVDAVAGGRPDRADAELRQLAAAGVSGIPLLWAVARRLRALLEARGAVEAGLSADAALGALRPPVFWRDKAAMSAQLRRWRSGALRNALDRLLDAERAIKARGSAGDMLAGQALLGVAVLASR